MTWPLYLGATMALIGVALIIAINLPQGLILVAESTIILILASIQVTVDRSGLTVRYGPFAWPRTRISLDRISQATVIDVARGSHGGWGYRGSMRLMGKAALVLRSGEALQVDLRDGKRFVVTIDDATDAAGTLNDLAGAAADS